MHAMFYYLVVAARLLLVFAAIRSLCCSSVHKSLAPMSRTLLGVWGQATLNFVAVATLLFFFFCVCPKFCDLAKQWRKIVVGVSDPQPDPVWGNFLLAGAGSHTVSEPGFNHGAAGCCLFLLLVLRPCVGSLLLPHDKQSYGGSAAMGGTSRPSGQTDNPTTANNSLTPHLDYY